MLTDFESSDFNKCVLALLQVNVPLRQATNVDGVWVRPKSRRKLDVALKYGHLTDIS